MNQRLFQSISYCTYWLDALDAHSIHSPFFFDLYNRLIKPLSHSKGIDSIESLRSSLLADETDVIVEDLGAGSRHFKSSNRQIKDIARYSLSPAKYSMLYRSLIQNNNAKCIIELGTSLGINTLYLGRGIDGRIYTFEGIPHVAKVASKQFKIGEADNIAIIQGNIDETLRQVLQNIGTVDFALIDANHKYKPTTTYFELLRVKANPHSVIVIDDIHYSAEMETAWKEIMQSKDVYGTVDLFRCGLVFFDPSLNRQHFVLQF